MGRAVRAGNMAGDVAQPQPGGNDSRDVRRQREALITFLMARGHKTERRKEHKTFPFCKSERNAKQSHKASDNAK